MTSGYKDIEIHIRVLGKNVFPATLEYLYHLLGNFLNV